ncbi:Na/Pi cotransporter family protein [Aureispira anguillae]|uniref:Na/Pi cotransporter family protein n=1 Tax=Aureispira anguillae TaxID=2864201 RepID=A0A915YAF4_9BACT|nr:Na/Pi cotransporter family protein [Aureispira anguillae]BDS09602.1 Na/Pi cotransporter family protein [Aureispira anguillae]
MDFGIGSIFQIVGALAFFIYGMKMMSDGIQQAAGAQLRNILRTMTQNRFLGVFTGFLITLLIQSSSATTVMTVSFVNAGLLSLTESAGVMIGANIGTTITGWIVSVLGFKVKLSAYSIPLFTLGVPLFFLGKGNAKYWGKFVIGFAILFLGLSELKGAVPSIKDNPEVLEALKNFTQWGILSRVFFVFVGTLLTIVVQSSSASMAITLTMCAEGWLPFDVAAAMILGENIGTTITAELASLIGNTAARRSARIHSLFNTVGVTWMVLVLPWFLPVLSNFVQPLLNIADPYTTPAAIPMALAAFHTSFNAINVCLILPFVPWLVKAAKYTVKEKEDEQEELLEFITNKTLSTELSTDVVQQETAYYGNVVGQMNSFLTTAINSIDDKEKSEAIKRLFKYEEITDVLEIKITEYITNLVDKENTHQTSSKLISYINIANDLERIGDIYFQIAKILEQKMEEHIHLLPEQRNGINEIISLIDEAFKVMNTNLSVSDYGSVEKGGAMLLESQINELKNQLRTQNLDRLSDQDYEVKNALIYNNLFSSLERIGDHIVNVTESVVGEI